MILLLTSFLVNACSGGSDSTGIPGRTLGDQPVAAISQGQSVLGKIVTLDGRNSRDPDGDILSYRWTFVNIPENSQSILVNVNNAIASFLPDVKGEYIVKLIVNDGNSDSAPTITTINIGSNRQPVAYAGSDSTLTSGNSIILNGNLSSDEDGDNLTYQWRIKSRPDGSNAIFNNARAVNPSFFAGIPGIYLIELTVNDGEIDSTADTLIVTAITPNAIPSAIAGPDVKVNTGTLIKLNGAGSNDADKNPLSFKWSLTNRPSGSLSLLINSNTVAPTFIPDVNGNYTVQLIVNDGTSDSLPDTITITSTVAVNGNTPPVADAGSNASVAINVPVNLNGANSSDADLDTLSYQWKFATVPTGSTATLINATTVSPGFTPNIPGNYNIQLIVGDGKDNSNPDTVTITAIDTNTKPVANAGSDITTDTGTLTTLDGATSSDVDNDSLVFKWSFALKPAGSNATLNSTSIAKPAFTPDFPGNYVAQLIVNDGKLDSNPDNIVIAAFSPNTPPVANAGADITIPINTTAVLDGTKSTDIDLSQLTYKWNFTSVPTGSTAKLNNDVSPKPEFIPDIYGDYVIQLIVNDGIDDSLPDEVIVSTTALCSTQKTYFLQNTWPVLNNACIGCHKIGGVTSPLNFVAETVTGFNDSNFDMFKTISDKKDSNGVSIILTKAANTNSDHGGSQRFPTSDPRYIALENMVARTESCIDDSTGQTGVILNTPYERLRKNTLALAGRLPTLTEENSVNSASTNAAIDIAINSILDQIMTENAFFDRLKEIYNDLLLTNAFPGTTALDTFDFGNFTDGKYFNIPRLEARGYSLADQEQVRSSANYGLERAPLELIAHVVRQNRPFTEILTANYVMVNPYSAKLFDLTFADGFEFNHLEPFASHNKNSFRQANIVDNNARVNPHAGVFTTLAFLTRYPSTNTNKNRARARYVFKYFLDTDVEGLADRAGLNLDNIMGEFPPLQDPQCAQCHNVIDPVAGSFKNWTNTGQFRGNFLNWFSERTPAEMLSPGYTNNTVDLLPTGQSGTALQWLAGRISTDTRFATATVKTLFTGLTGKLPDAQYTQLFESLKTDLVNSNFNLKSLIKNILNSNEFRASNLAAIENPALYPNTGMGRLLTPEQLDRKIQAVTGGYRWASPSGRRLIDASTYLLLYGGINSYDIITRITDPTSLVRGIQQRIAQQTACEVTPTDFSLTSGNRKLLPFVQLNDTPDNATGIANIKQNIQFLHKHILGEELTINDPEINRTYDLFSSVWNVTTGNNIPVECRANLATTHPVAIDANFTVRAWIAVVSYLLNDYKFLYE